MFVSQGARECSAAEGVLYIHYIHTHTHTHTHTYIHTYLISISIYIIINITSSVVCFSGSSRMCSGRRRPIYILYTYIHTHTHTHIHTYIHNIYIYLYYNKRNFFRCLFFRELENVQRQKASSSGKAQQEAAKLAAVCEKVRRIGLLQLQFYGLTRGDNARHVAV